MLDSMDASPPWPSLLLVAFTGSGQGTSTAVYSAGVWSPTDESAQSWMIK